MAKIVTIRQADIVNAFKRTGLPTAKYGGFEDGFKLGAQFQAAQELEDQNRATNFGMVIPVVEIRVVS
jgi:hypothetical protein